MSMSKGSKMLQYINYRMRVTIQDGCHLVGKFMAFDRHMNLVLSDCEEFRHCSPTKDKKTIESRIGSNRRTLGLVLVLGEEVVSMTVEGPPPPDESRAKAVSAALAGPSLCRAAGRGVPIAPLVQAQPGLPGPIRGVGGPAPGMIQPQIAPSHSFLHHSYRHPAPSPLRRRPPQAAPLARGPPGPVPVQFAAPGNQGRLRPRRRSLCHRPSSVSDPWARLRRI